VALSRISELDGLYLTRPLRPSDIIVDENVLRFMSRAATIPGIEA
jgi:ATP-dependent DNA helicase PIF1